MKARQTRMTRAEIQEALLALDSEGAFIMETLDKQIMAMDERLMAVEKRLDDLKRCQVSDIPACGQSPPSETAPRSR